MKSRCLLVGLSCGLGWLAPQPASAAELIAYFPFEDEYADASGNGNDAAPSQNPDQLEIVDGFRGKSLSIIDPDTEPNSGGSVDIPIDANPFELPAVTFGGWVNVAEGFEFDGFMATDNGGWDRGITVNAQATNAFGVASGAAPVPGGAITPGQWQYVVATFDADELTTSIYVGDNVPSTQALEAAAGEDLTDIGEPVIELGRYDNQDLNGLVDDIFVFEGALDAHQVAAIRNLRLSALDYAPDQAAALFALFEAGNGGEVGGVTWETASGLVADSPGAVISLDGGLVAVLLDDTGNGMQSTGDGIENDSDGDGLDDAWERAEFGDLGQSAEDDTDEDGLTNAQEVEQGTRGSISDTDSDGLADGTEVNDRQTDPLNPDTDGDGDLDGVDPDPLDPSVVSRDAAPALLAYYAFEGDYVDGSNAGNNAMPSQNPDELSFVEDGFRGQSLKINDPDADNNSGGSVDIPVNANPSELPGVTFGGWVNVADGFEFDGFMATDNGGWDRGITVNAQDSQAFGVASGAAPTHGAEIETEEWQYVVATFDSEEGDASLFVGDSMVSSQALDSVVGGDLTDTGEPVIEIGRYDNQDLNGLVDDVFVFDAALNSHQVAAIRNLRLSSLDYSPRDVASLFVLFASNQPGTIGDVGWEPVAGLATDIPGAVTDVGDGNFTVLLDQGGNGMQSGVDVAPSEDPVDNLDDFWELEHFGNLEQTDEGDPDEDGLTNLEEFELKTRPTLADTDRDGLLDGAEVNEYMTDPSNIDTDGDSRSDGREVAEGTDPLVADPPEIELLAYYDFEGSYDDLSGSGNDAQPDEFTEEQLSFGDGFRGLGLDIMDPDADNNTGGLVNIPIDANPATHPEVSFGGWVNISDQFEFDGFMAIDNGGWDRGITINAQDSQSFGIASGGSPVNAGAITPDEWQFVMATFSQAGNESVLYVGSSDSDVLTTETADTPDATAEGEQVIEIGRYDNQDMAGFVDDVFVFSGALSDHQANAIRNLRLSVHDYSPLLVAEVFQLFSDKASGAVGEFTWTPVSGLDTSEPGAVNPAGAGYTVVLNDAGDGMMSSPAQRFEILSITRDSETSVTLTWEAEPGLFYAVDVSQDLLNWEVLVEALLPEEMIAMYTDMSDEIATQPERYYRVREQAAPALFSDGFEDGAGDWTVGVIVDFPETATTWEAGPPANGPAEAFAGQNVFGTGLGANYEDGTGVYLRSPVIDLTGAGRAKLTFHHYMEAADGEGGRLNILDENGAPLAGGAGLRLFVGPDGNTGDWSKESIRLPEFNVPVILEFEFLSAFDDDPINRPGWFIDEVEVD